MEPLTDVEKLQLLQSGSASSLPGDLERLFEHVDGNKTRYIDTLREIVAIKSISAWPENRSDIGTAVDWVADKLRKLGAEVELVNIGTQTLRGANAIPLPKVILGTLGADSTKKTVCVYGHLDVVQAKREDGWETEPFVLTEKDGKLYGRGSTDDKGPVLCWLHAIEGYQTLGIPLPVNLKFVFEGMEENGSLGFDSLMHARKNDFLKSVDYVCVSDNYWLGKEKPCVTYGLRGVCHFNIQIEGAAKDLHSGVFGGTLYEPMTDLISMLDTLVDKNGHILVDGIYDQVIPETEEELKSYESISFDVAEYRNGLGCKKLPYNEDKVQILLHRWRYPTVSIHGIEGAVHEPGNKTIIPRKVMGKFSLRIVPNQTPAEVERLVIKHLNAKWEERGSSNSMEAYLVNSQKPWITDPNHPHYEAAKKATKHVYKVDPDLTREGGSIGVTLSLQEATGKNVVLIPIGAADDSAHSENEKFNIRNYIEGTKLLGAYLYEVAQLE